MVLRKKLLITLLDIFQKMNKQKKLNKNPTKNKNQSEKIQPVLGGGKSNMRKQNKKFSKNN